MEGSRASDDSRFRALFDTVYEPLQRYVRRRAAAEYADDVVADTLLVAWRRLDTIPPGAELPWCYATARRCLANQRRSEARRLGLVERLHAEAANPPVSGPDAAMDSTRAALAGLREEDREVLELWAWEGLAAREIATVLGISANAASIRLHRAKRRLGNALAGGKDLTVAGHDSGGARKGTR